MMKTYHNVRTVIKYLVLLALFIFINAFIITNAMYIGRQYSNIHIRFDAPIQNSQAIALRSLATQNTEAYPVWPTYWVEGEAVFQSNLAFCSTTYIMYSGNGLAVWPTDFVAGHHPAEIATNQMSISTGLADSLYGDHDVIGLELEMSGQYYTVCGVFHDEENIALISIADQTPISGWTSIVLLGDIPGDIIKFTEDYLKAAGINNAADIIDGEAISAYVMAFAQLPLILVVLSNLMFCFNGLWHGMGKKRFAFFFSVALIIAVFLPSIFELVPDNFIPNRWSDFSFWGRLFNQEFDKIRTWISIDPSLIDVSVKISIIKVFIGLTPAAILSYILCRAPHTRSSEPNTLKSLPKRLIKEKSLQNYDIVIVDEL